MCTFGAVEGSRAICKLLVMPKEWESIASLLLHRVCLCFSVNHFQVSQCILCFRFFTWWPLASLIKKNIISEKNKCSTFVLKKKTQQFKLVRLGEQVRTLQRTPLQHRKQWRQNIFIWLFSYSVFTKSGSWMCFSSLPKSPVVFSVEQGDVTLGLQFE